MGEKQEITWRNDVKDVLFIIFTLCLVVFPQFLILSFSNIENLIFSMIVFKIGFFCGCVAYYWHQQNIHITKIGLCGGLFIFLVSTVVFWKTDLSLWPNILIFAHALIESIVKKINGIFCPECGGMRWEPLFGGRASRSCVYCDKALYCRESLFDGETKVKIIQDSLPIKNPLRALWLRWKHNKIPGNKKRGRKNIAKTKAFHRECAENARKMKENLKKIMEFIEKSQKNKKGSI